MSGLAALPPPALRIGTLALTIAVEWPIPWALQRRPTLALLPLAALINTATQPAATRLVTGWGWPLWPVEGLVCSVESALLAALLPPPWYRALPLAIAANGASAGLGLLLFG